MAKQEHLAGARHRSKPPQRPRVLPTPLLLPLLLLLLLSCPPNPGAQATVLDDLVANAAGACASGAVLRGATCQGPNVVALNLSTVPVGGPIPAGISQLRALTLLDLSYCALTGPLPPELGALPSLRVLALRGNSALGGTVPDSLSRLSSLQRLDLGGVLGLTGPIPEFLGSLRNLSILSLRSTDVTGSIPHTLSRLASLVALELGLTYRLSGALPPGLGQLTSLTRLSISGATLNGSIPAAYSGMTSLRELELASCQLSGLIPAEIGGLTLLSLLRLSGNTFSGGIPPTLGSLVSLRTMILTSNHLSESIPDSLGELTGLRDLRLKGNQLWGPIPGSFSALAALTFLDVSSNHLSGAIPLPMGSPTAELHFDRNFFSSVSSRTPCRDPGLTAEGNCFAASMPCAGTNRDVIQCQHFSDTAPKEVSKTAPPAQHPPPLGEVEDSSPTSQGVPLVVVLGGGMAGGILLIGALVGCVVALLCLRRLRQAQREGDAGEEGCYSELHGLRRFSMEELSEVTNGFNAENEIGSGTFSTVYCGVLPSGDPHLPNHRVAVKRQLAKSTKFSQEAMARTFLNEAKILSRASHPNLVTLRGTCSEPGQRCLVLDYVVNGNLRNLLNRSVAHTQAGAGAKPNALELTWERRLQIALGAARGLHYLHHEMRPEIVHLDLKSENILVDEAFVAKVSDFGIAKVSLECRSKEGASSPAVELRTKNYRGTPGYIDPFFYADPTLTKKSDVYSFGVVLLELATDWAPLGKGSPHILHRVLSGVSTEGFASVAAPSIRGRLREPAEGRSSSSSSSGGSSLEMQDLENPVVVEDPEGIPEALFKRFLCLGLWCCVFVRTERPCLRQIVEVLSSIEEGRETLGEEMYVLDYTGMVDDAVYSFVTKSRASTLASTMGSTVGSSSGMSCLRSLGSTLSSRDNVASARDLSARLGSGREGPGFGDITLARNFSSRHLSFRDLGVLGEP